MAQYDIGIDGRTPVQANTESLDQLDIQVLNDRQLHAIINGKSVVVDIHQVNLTEKTIELSLNGVLHRVAVTTKLDRLINEMGLTLDQGNTVSEVKAPMPGLVLSISVDIGDEVQKGDSLLILEAMKMENVIKAPGDGVVEEILVAPGTAVEKGMTLVRFAD